MPPPPLCPWRRLTPLLGASAGSCDQYELITGVEMRQVRGVELTSGREGAGIMADCIRA